MKTEGINCPWCGSYECFPIDDPEELKEDGKITALLITYCCGECEKYFDTKIWVRDVEYDTEGYD